MIRVLLSLILFSALRSSAQPNCNIYKSNNNQACYEACLISIEAEKYQASAEAQLQFDRAIQQCPNFDYAYIEKSVPYLKTGDFIEWKKLIDKAVELNPVERLGYRGWCRYQFVRDYKGAIEDFEKLDSITQFDIGYSQNGDYHLNIAKALCYKGIGNKKKAIEIIEKQLAEKGYTPMPYDYLHLGVLKMESGDAEEGIKYLKKSISFNDYLAEPYYYLGLIYKRQSRGKEFKENMEKARTFYLKGYKRFDSYTHPMDKVFLSEIEAELKNIN